MEPRIVDEEKQAQCLAGTCPNGCDGWWLRESERPDGHRAARYVACPRRQERIAAKLIESSRLPPGLRAKTLERFRPTPGTQAAYAAVRGLIESTQHGVVLAGAPGTGKTHLAAAVVNHRLATGREALFVTVPALLDDLRRGVRDETGDVQLDVLRTTPVLVLDDLGAERVTEFALERLFVLLNDRLLHERATLVTTNFSRPSELQERFGGAGARLVSRLREMATWIVLSGPDVRVTGVPKEDRP